MNLGHACQECIEKNYNKNTTVEHEVKKIM